MAFFIKKIAFPDKNLIETHWNDGFRSVIKLEVLRNNCPCADCQENKGKSQSGFINLNTFKPGKFNIKKINVVGNYAINPIWEDGHDTGIYPFDFLRNLFENYKLNDEEINKIIKINNQSQNN
ncbi:MAG TPA: DUF971 domain-containing protein [Candidatus Kapabacteria bacterium]|jgi:DUF971 family protein|nr:DUF971 domain-containing protein [Candidatus Kapabacteria bacterium]